MALLGARITRLRFVNRICENACHTWAHCPCPFSLAAWTEQSCINYILDVLWGVATFSVQEFSRSTFSFFGGNNRPERCSEFFFLAFFSLVSISFTQGNSNRDKCFASNCTECTIFLSHPTLNYLIALKFTELIQYATTELEAKFRIHVCIRVIQLVLCENKN